MGNGACIREIDTYKIHDLCKYIIKTNSKKKEKRMIKNTTRNFARSS